MSKYDYLNDIYDSYIDEFKDMEFVPGSGNADSRLLLIGEAPGKDEVRLSKPFVGKAGQHLNEFLEYLGIQREDIYITNAIKYRLSKTDPETGRVSNRPAKRDEINLSSPYLLKEIDIIKPEYIVTLGNVPLRAITGDYGISIGNMHGEVTKVRILENEYRLFALYHPASVIYNRSLKSVYIDDIKKLKNTMSDAAIQGIT